jgi:Flp pilus assembly protein TadD
MKYLTLSLLLVLAACSSTDKSKQAPKPSLSNEAFKKERPLSQGEIKDHYTASISSASPALQDETLDRYTPAELSQVQADADPLMTMAVKCIKGDIEGAFATASAAFNKYHKVAVYWNQVANCHLNQGNARKALLFYNKALEVSPDYAPAMNNIGVMFARQGQDQKAVVAFEKASKSSRFSKTPRYNLARLYLNYGLADLSLPVFSGLLEGSPRDVGLLNSVASSHFLLGDYQAALTIYQRIPTEQWSSAEIGLNLAFTLKRLGRGQDALKVFNGIKDPQTEELKRYWAVVRGQLGDKQ